jgi:histidine triad (HIT) family protein
VEECLFCKIVRGEIPSEKIFEDDHVLGFKDIQPVAPTHLLFIPKEHHSTVIDTPDHLFSHLFSAAKEVAQREGLDRSGFRTLFNMGEDGGQVVYHTHLHLIGGKKLGKMG